MLLLEFVYVVVKLLVILHLEQPINIIPKEHFYSIFGNVIKDFYNNKEDEDN